MCIRRLCIERYRWICQVAIGLICKTKEVKCTSNINATLALFISHRTRDKWMKTNKKIAIQYHLNSLFLSFYRFCFSDSRRIHFMQMVFLCGESNRWSGFDILFSFFSLHLRLLFCVRLLLSRTTGDKQNVILAKLAHSCVWIFQNKLTIYSRALNGGRVLSNLYWSSDLLRSHAAGAHHSNWMPWIAVVLAHRRREAARFGYNNVILTLHFCCNPTKQHQYILHIHIAYRILWY